MLEAPKDGKKHRYKPNRMSDAEIIVILIHFHSGGFRCFKHYYLHYICKHCKDMFPNTISYNRFVELEKEVLLQLTVFIKKSCWENARESVLLTAPLCVYAVTNVSISTKLLMVWLAVGSVL